MKSLFPYSYYVTYAEHLASINMLISSLINKVITFKKGACLYLRRRKRRGGGGREAKGKEGEGEQEEEREESRGGR